MLTFIRTFHISSLSMKLHRMFLMLIFPNIYISDTSSVPKVDTTKPGNHISEQDPSFLNHMVSHFDCAKQNNFRHFSLLNVEHCTQATTALQHTRTQATIYLRAKAKSKRAFKFEAYIETEENWCSQAYGTKMIVDIAVKTQ